MKNLSQNNEKPNVSSNQFELISLYEIIFVSSRWNKYVKIVLPVIIRSWGFIPWPSPSNPVSSEGMKIIG